MKRRLRFPKIRVPSTFWNSMALAAVLSVCQPDAALAQGGCNCANFSLINPDFEANNVPNNTFQFINQANVPGWETTDPSGAIEIWGSGFGGVPAFAGHNFAELQANNPSSLFQDLATCPGQIYSWKAAHRGRATTETARLEFGPPGGPYTTIQVMVDGTTAWGTYSGSYTVPAGQTTTRVRLTSVVPATGSVGNFVDDFLMTPVFCTTDDDNDGYTEVQGDCDDNDPTVYPGAIELCDNKDNNCKGLVDDEKVAPSISGCPANISIGTGPNATTCSRNVSWTPPTATDNCGGVTFTTTHQPGASFPKGTTTVTYTFTDSHNNSSTCSFNVTVTDNTLPAISPVSNIVMNADPGVCNAKVGYPKPTFTDNCPSCATNPLIGFGYTYLGNYNGHSYYKSPTKGAWTYYDSVGVSVGGYLVTLGSAQEDSFVAVTAGELCWMGLTDKDSEGIWKWSNGEPLVFQNWCNGQPDNAFEGQDFGVINYGVGGPNTSCWDDGNLLPNPCCTYGIIEMTECAAPVIVRTAGLDSGSTFPLGITTVTYTATDASNNSSSATFTVTVVDNQPPVITCPANVTISCSANTSPAANGTATATDNCGIASITSSDVSSQVASLTACAHYNYTIQRTWTATDVNGKTSSCIQIITVQDVVLPTAVCKNATVYLNANGSASVAAADVNNGSSDNCSPVVLSVSPATFGCAQAGQNVPVTLTVADACGNQSTCNAMVSVKDTTRPAIMCPGTKVVDYPGNTTPTAGGAGIATATDNCGATNVSITNSDVSTKSSDATLCSYYNYTITRTWTATDASGNSSTCTQLITVRDVTPPVALCKPATVYVDGSGNVTVVPSDVNNGSSDNSGMVILTVSPNTFSCAQIGQNVLVTLTAKDACNNQSTCTAMVTVKDNTKPVITCPIDKTVAYPGNTAPTNAGTGAATATDNCGATNVSITSSDVSTKSTNSALCSYYTYTITRTWKATDASGNFSTCTQTINVQDVTPPVAACKPATVYVDGSGNVTVVPSDVNNGSSDLASPVTLTVSPNTFSCAQIGQSVQVTLTVKDACNNQSTCNAMVTVKDNTKPVITCPLPKTVNYPGNTTPTLAGTGVATATDNCGTGNVSITSSDVSTKSTNSALCSYYTYTITRTWKATDASGNYCTCTQTINVQDDTDPLAKCKNATVTLVNGAASITPASVNNGSSDNASGVTLSVSPSTFTCAQAGTNVPVVLTVKDVCGNTSTCTASVTVTGAKPSCSISVAPCNSTNTGGVPTNIYLGYGPQSVTLNLTTTGGTCTYLWSGPTAKLSCTTCKNPVFTPTKAGTYTFTATVKNANGCTSTCSVTFCVKDIRVPNNCSDNDDDDDKYCNDDDDDDYSRRNYCNDNDYDDDDDDHHSNYYSSNKVYICHNGHTLSISTSAVYSHLKNHSGDRLGKCGSVCGSAVNARIVNNPDEKSGMSIKETLAVKAYPNPFNDGLHLMIESNAFASADITITDLTGRKLEYKPQQPVGEEIVVGQNLAPGIYIVDVRHGTNARQVKVIKL